MKTLRQIGLLSMFAALLLSCSQSNVDTTSDSVIETPGLNYDPSNICFEAVSSDFIATRGEPVNTSIKIPSMGVIGYWAGNKVVEQEATVGGGIWALNPAKSWDVMTEIAFTAYSPYPNANNGVSIVENSEDETVIAYRVPELSKNQPDLMTASTVEENGNLVKLKFGHHLACVSFSVKGNPYKKIQSIQLKGLVNKGELKINSADGTVAWQNCEITTEANSHTVTMADDTFVESDSKLVVAEDGYLMMIPQTVSSSTMIVVNIVDKYTGELESRVYQFEDGTEWLAGNSYNYVIEVPKANTVPVDYTYEEPANCYMIHPTGDVLYVYIPVEERINEYWGDTYDAPSKKTYQTTPVKERMLTDDHNEWYAEIAWHDCMGGIEGLLIERATEGFIGEGDATGLPRIGDPNFQSTQCSTAMLVTLPSYLTEGNVVVVVKNMAGQILWSWHLWITSYNPDLKPELTIGTEDVNASVPCQYNVGGTGFVHRYKDRNTGDDLDENDTSGSYDYQSYYPIVWSKNQIYQHRYMMDRNLGSRTPTTHSGDAGAIYYQPGRKDPFPGNVVFYPSYVDSYGETFTYGPAEGATGNVLYNTSSARKTMLFAVENPTCYCYYDGSSDPYSWISYWRNYVTGAYYKWNDVKAYHVDTVTEQTNQGARKSIYDPSPLGWEIPLPSVINDVTYTAMASAPVGGLAATYPVTGEKTGWVVFPYNGYRSTGSISATSSCYLWFNKLMGNSESQACMYNSSSEADLVRSTGAHTTARQVRCIRQYDTHPIHYSDEEPTLK